jgi:sec-independent protein translocase protein TatA
MFYKSPTTDLIIILVVVLLIFGPKRIPMLGRQIGQGMREFKDGITGRSKDSETPDRPEIEQASADAAPVTRERESAPVSTPERRA